MVRRWLIRLPFLLALALVVGVWVASYFAAIAGGFPLAGSEWGFGAVQGLGFAGERPQNFPGEWLGIDYEPHISAKQFGLPPTFLGFHVGGMAAYPTGIVVIFPIWLPMIAMVGLCWLVWRKTRPAPLGRAFPIESDKKETEKI